MANPVTWEGKTADWWQQLLDVPAVVLYQTTGSTNDAARELAEAGAASLSLVVADHQTRGRGRGGNRWLSEPGTALLFSMIFHSRTNEDSAIGAAPVRIGCAVAEAIERVADVEARVKWPNDVVIPNHGKVAGVLCEAVVRQGIAYVVAGIGVNVRSAGLNYVSLDSVSRSPIARGELLAAIVAAAKPFADTIARPLDSDELAALRDRDILFQREVVDDSGLAGIASGIAPDGSLWLQTADGLRSIHNATIRLAGTQGYPGAPS
ncbi:MAG TPA: biotin--[acetyl-CoA-carboxylase] ligase [Longimicrobiales bacterium]|nr:biotin--[acetyl-CoA-carboxylase] ligase [Longimicrobiales bacterium]